MEPLALDAITAPLPRLQVDSVEGSDEDEDASRLIEETGGADESLATLDIVSLDAESRSPSLSPRSSRSGSQAAMPKMGRESTPFFNAMFLFAVLVAVLSMFNMGLGIKVELKLGNSHAEWTSSLWWGAAVNLIICLMYLLVHLTIQKSWAVAKYAFLFFMFLLVAAMAICLAALNLSFSTYKNVQSVDTGQCTYSDYQGTYFPLTSCYDPCQAYLNQTLNTPNPRSVCCCCAHTQSGHADHQNDEIIYLTSVSDCSLVDSSETELRYLTVCYVVSFTILFIMFAQSLLIQLSCCGIVAPWRYMILHASNRYSIN